MVLSKFGETMNFAPPYIDDKLMTKNVAFTRKGQDENGDDVYEAEPLLREIKPLAPVSLAFLFPFELNRSLQIAHKAKGISALTETRLQQVLINLGRFFVTICLVIFPSTLWVQLYVYLTLPLRALTAFDAIGDMSIDMSTIKEVFGIKSGEGDDEAEASEQDGGDDSNGNDDGADSDSDDEDDEDEDNDDNDNGNDEEQGRNEARKKALAELADFEDSEDDEPEDDVEQGVFTYNDNAGTTVLPPDEQIALPEDTSGPSECKQAEVDKLMEWAKSKADPDETFEMENPKPRRKSLDRAPSAEAGDV